MSTRNREPFLLRASCVVRTTSYRQPAAAYGVRPTTLEAVAICEATDVG